MNIVGIIVFILVVAIATHIFFKVVVPRYKKISLIYHIGKCVLLALGNVEGWDDMFVEMLGDFKTDKRMQANTFDDFRYLTDGIHDFHNGIQNEHGDVTITIALDDSRTAANKAILEILEVLADDADMILDRTEALESRILPSIKDLMDIKWGTAVV
ncbi:MAG: hypothetical protein ACYCU8_00910 [Ferrimicrobium acidiphilum]